MGQSISVLLVDDHAMVREMLTARLAAEAGIRVVGLAANADHAVAQAGALKPDVIVMDIDMPGLSCFEAARAIAARCPDAAVVFLSAFAHDRYIEQALWAGAAGYITKSESTSAVVDAIRTAAAGGAYYSPHIRARIVLDATGPHLGAAAQTRSSALTRRELEVLGYLARAMSSKEIACTMHLSVRTVDNKVTRMMHKVGVHSRLELLAFATREGLVAPPAPAPARA